MKDEPKEQITQPEEALPSKALTPEQYAYQREQYVSWADTQLDRLHERHTLSGQEFDKQIVALSGGGLALTLTLAKDIFDKGNVHLTWMVYLSWAFFLLALTINLLSHRTAASHYNLMTDRMGHLRASAITSVPTDNKVVGQLTVEINRLTPRLKHMNDGALFLTLAGIALFVIFITYNRHNHAQESRTRTTTATNPRPRLNKSPVSDGLPVESTTSARAISPVPNSHIAPAGK